MVPGQSQIGFSLPAFDEGEINGSEYRPCQTPRQTALTSDFDENPYDRTEHVACFEESIKKIVVRIQNDDPIIGQISEQLGLRSRRGLDRSEKLQMIRPNIGNDPQGRLGHFTQPGCLAFLIDAHLDDRRLMTFIETK